MTTKEFKQAIQLAEDKTDLSGFDIDCFDGCGLLDFKPIFVSIGQVARFIEYQARYLCGGWDQTELQYIANIARRKFQIV